MKVFIDANVIIAVLNKEYPLFSSAARILSLNKKTGIQLYTSPLVLAIAFYFSTKKNGEELAKKKIEILVKQMDITILNDEISKNSIQDVRVHVFEDGLEYYSALNESCDYIITENGEDFYFSEIPIVNCEQFLSEIVK